MSLLEDVFLEDEADEAQDLERIIEGDEFDDRPRSRADNSDENSAKEDEAEEEKVRVDPTNTKPKRVIKNPRFVLNPARLTGPRGIQVLPEHFKDFKFKGKGHEKSDLDLVLKKLEHWAYRLYPKFQFEDCLKKIETLGKKRAVAVHLTKLRMDMLSSEETVLQKESSEDEAQDPSAPEEQDEFDKLLQQQIDKARATPTSASKTPFTERASLMPKATSSPSINDEQRERMLRNRQMAEERRLAKLKQNISQEKGIENDFTTKKNPTANVNVDSGETDVTNQAKGNKNDVVEHDDNGIVVSSSHVPAKKHNTSGVDNANYVAIDIDDSSKNIVEIDIDTVTKSPRTYVPAKKHNRSRIDSSDDDDASEPVIDVENHHKDPKKLKSNTINNKGNIAHSSDDENVSELITIDDENHHNIGRTKKSNIIDSSDDDESLVMNESITADVHYSNKDDISSMKHDNSNISEIISNEKEINENDSVFDTLITNDAGNKNIVDVNKHIELDSVESNVSSSNVSIDITNEMNVSTDTVQNSDKNKVSQIDEGEKLMDVDFSDDF